MLGVVFFYKKLPFKNVGCPTDLHNQPLSLLLSVIVLYAINIKDLWITLMYYDYKLE